MLVMYICQIDYLSVTSNLGANNGIWEGSVPFPSISHSHLLGFKENEKFIKVDSILMG